ncbi:TetR/AcrR family transcriptional regulator [Rugosimonospora africana]|uniref:TetR family transcriptional regulator n=1 Tax=Rugosimonospora africana TaxID=556532 RepID=A0A8J3QN06_9ACTN|nr:TetR/AcrR family transcriptional regulator [Rugosimonospora africana]GIH13934.1 TetR family transcriptional regulator [Rugosimonospora africana]
MPRRAGLTAQKVVELALSIVDSAGLDGLTLARVAEAAGVATPSLYKHVAGLPDLRERVARVVLAGLTDRTREAVIGVSGDDAIRALMDAYRSYLVEFPNRAGFLISPPPTVDPREDLLAVVLAVLRGYRLEGSEAIHAARILRSSVHGFASLEAAGGFGYREDLDESFRRLAGVIVMGLRERV